MKRADIGKLIAGISFAILIVFNSAICDNHAHLAMPEAVNILTGFVFGVGIGIIACSD